METTTHAAFALAAERRHLWAGWGWVRRDHRAGPDGVGVGEFAGGLTYELDALAEQLRAETFVWGPIGAATFKTLPFTVRDRVAAAALRSALRETSRNEMLTCSHC